MHVPGATLHTGGANYRGSKDIIQKTSPGYDDGLERGGGGRKGEEGGLGSTDARSYKEGKKKTNLPTPHPIRESGKTGLI